MTGKSVPTGKPMTVETLLEPGSSGKCEDVLLVSGHLYGVFDGGLAATAAASEVFGGRTSASLVELCDEAKKRVAELGEAASMAGASVLRVERDGLDWVNLGRGEIVVVLPDGSFEHLSAREGAAEVKSGRRQLEGVRHVLLFTDGLLGGAGDDLSGLVTRFMDGGLSAAMAPARASAERRDVAAVALSFLPPNPARAGRKKPKTKRPKQRKSIPPRRKKARPPEV